MVDTLVVSPDQLGASDSEALVAAGSGTLGHSQRHALVHGLRNRRDEAQLTSVVGAIARTDPVFARAFAEALIEQGRTDCPRSHAAFEALGALPRELTCASEQTLYDEAGRRIGRVDLLFEHEGIDPFVLVVENKLYSGFGHAQLARYQAGVRVVRGHGGRGGLIALTRDVPTTGELRTGDDEWLGSVRWAKLLPRLRRLHIGDRGVAAQWQLLLDVLNEQGDLGMTQMDAGAVRAWSRYFEGRQQLQWLLEQIFSETLDHTRAALAKSRRRPAGRDELAELWYKPPARKVLIQHTQAEIQFGISVPASYTGQTLRVGCWMEDPGEVGFGVTVAPRDAGHLLDQSDRNLLRQLKTLTAHGFEQVGANAEWYSSHGGESVLSARDAPSALLEAVKADISTIADSKILGRDLETPVPRARRRKRGEPWG